MLDADTPTPAATKLFTIYLKDHQMVDLYQCFICVIVIQALWFFAQTAATAAESYLVWEDEICSIWSR